MESFAVSAKMEVVKNKSRSNFFIIDFISPVPQQWDNDLNVWLLLKYRRALFSLLCTTASQKIKQTYRTVVVKQFIETLSPDWSQTWSMAKVLNLQKLAISSLRFLGPVFTNFNNLLILGIQ